jgi:hypothetical protein
MRRPILRWLLAAAAIFTGIGSDGFAQLAPQIGYVFPPGGQTGTTVNIRLGGQNLTPDMQFFVHDPRVRLEILGPPGDILITPPPYWKGNKCNIADAPMAREIPARITIPADMPAGTIEWELANANGVSNVGKFIIGNESEVVEDELNRREPQLLPGLPITVSGRLSRIEEVDQYRFLTPNGGLVNCELLTHRLGTSVHGVLEVRDAAGNMVADTVDTEGTDPVLTFAAETGGEYVVSVHDLDFSGNGSFVYRLRFAQGPRVLAVVPAVSQRGETRSIRFLGLGVASGEPELESVTREVAFPSDLTLKTYEYVLETPFGVTSPVKLAMGDAPVLVGSPDSDGNIQPFTPPVGITARLDSSAEQRFQFEGKQGDVWDLKAEAQHIGSPLDVMLVVLGPDGKELANNDDADGSTDAALQFSVPTDGLYSLVVSDHISGAAGTPLAFFHLSLNSPPKRGFELTVPPSLNVGLGAATELTVNAVRNGGFAEPISVELSGLPDGFTVPGDLVIPADATELKFALTSAADSAVVAKMVEVTATAQTSGTRLTKNMLVAMTMKPRCSCRPVVKDGGLAVHRGTTHPGEVIVERLEEFEGEIQLIMSSSQSRHRQGICGPQAVIVPPGDTRAFYPTYVPEWLGTNLTQRMSLSAVAHVSDPKGNLRHLVSPMSGNIVMSIEGALLKLTHQPPDIAVRRGASFELPIQILRSKKLPAPVRLELEVSPEYATTLAADPITVGADQDQAQFHINVVTDAPLTGEVRFAVKGTAMDAANLPVVARTHASIAVE